MLSEAEKNDKLLIVRNEFIILQLKEKSQFIHMYKNTYLQMYTCMHIENIHKRVNNAMKGNKCNKCN